MLQTVRAQESSIVAYKVANLLQFYTVTMMRTIGEEAVLSRTLKEYVFLSFTPIDPRSLFSKVNLRSYLVV